MQANRVRCHGITLPPLTLLVLIILSFLSWSTFADDKANTAIDKGTVGNPVVIASLELDAPRLMILEKLVGEIYDRAGIFYIFQRYPIARSVLEASRGQADAELVRFLEVTELLPNLTLTPLPVPLFTLEFKAFSLREAPVVLTLEELSGSRVGVPRGIHLLDKFLAQTELHHGDSLESMFKMLALHRLDYVVYMDAEGDKAIQEFHFEKEISSRSVAIIHAKLYHFVNEKYPEIIQRLSRVAMQMEQNGELAKFTEQLMLHID